MATIKLFGNLRKHSNAAQLQIPGASIQSVIETLCQENPALWDALFLDGQIRQHFKITLNGHDISLAEGMDTAVSEDDQIAIFPPIAGG